MFWSRLLKSAGMLPQGRTPEECDVCSVEEFRKSLERARARSDRNAHSFSVAVFEFAEASEQSEALKKFSQILVRRVRMTDVVGWFDQRRLAVLLDGASSEGAWKLVDDVCGKAQGTVSRWGCQVYTYPYEEGSDGGSRGDASRGGTSSRGFKPMPFPSTTDVRPWSGGPTNGRSAPRRCAMRLEPLLSNPIPPYKRALDIVFGCVALLFFLPVFLLTALLIKIISPGPVFFKQQRIGYLGRPFTFWKFRTMDVKRDAAEHEKHVREFIHSEKPMSKLDDVDPQIIPMIGKLLRNSCLDELPQLFNVLRGNMSLIGPRPCLPYEYEEFLLWHKRRFETLPGMTGLWQVNGKNRTSFKQMIRYDIAYEYHRSLWFDIKILLKTPFAILSQMIDSLARRRKAHEIFN